MEKLETFVRDYEAHQLDELPKFLKRRVDALKKIQLEHVEIQTKYHQELQELEMKYEKLYTPLYEKRAKIINGEHEPTDEECTLPANIAENECDGDQENKQEEAIKPLLTEEEEKAIESQVKGIPGFWLGTLSSNLNFSESIEPHDRPILRKLEDVKLCFEEKGEFLTYRLDFHFGENPHFTNKVLSKTYYLKKKPDEKDPFSFDGYEVCKSEGCEINWNEGKDVTRKIVTVKQKNKTDGRIREKKKEVERDSFFYFFKPPQPIEIDPAEMSEELASLYGIDFELGEIFRQCLIPRAVLYYAGYIIDVDDEDEDDEDDDEDDDVGGYGAEDSDDDSDLLDSDESDASDASEATDDSLDTPKDKKKLIGKKSPKKSP